MIKTIFSLASGNIDYLYELLKHFEVQDDSNIVQLKEYIEHSMKKYLCLILESLT